MKDWHQKLFILSFVILITLPLTYTIGVKDRTKLYGWDPVTALPSLQEKSWRRRDFQKEFESWWTYHFGFRKVALKLKNTLYDLANFNRIHAGYSGTLIETAGRRQLIEKSSITNFCFESCQQDEGTLIPKLQKLVRFFQADNRQVMFVLGSTKAYVYEEDLPRRFKFFARKEKFDVFQYWENLFERLHISYFNTLPMIKKMAREEGYEPYSRTGTHWSPYASCRVTQEILKKLGRKSVEIKEIRRSDVPLFGERDLAVLLNSYIPFLSDERFFQVNPVASKEGNSIKTALVGDSYTGSIMAYLPRDNYANNSDMIQMFNRVLGDDEMASFFNDYNIYLFVSMAANWNNPYALMFQNIDKILERLPTHFLHGWLRNEQGSLVSTEGSCIVIPNVDKTDVRLSFTVSQPGGKLFVNGKELSIDRCHFEVVLLGKNTDEKYRFFITFKTEKPIILSQISVHPISVPPNKSCCSQP